MRPFDRELSALERRSVPPVVPLIEVGMFLAELRDLDRLGPSSLEEPGVEAHYREFGLPPGPPRHWFLRASCGLDFILSQDFYTEDGTVLAEEPAELDHMLAHLPFPIRQKCAWRVLPHEAQQ